ncbi:MAG: DegT/DnrJ/EryC1/StrS family aminotransferase [Actinobacteria bacterium]|nr:DegT/DnrJ/EryC1/StrS family aminotransferase [Actinomycetota bacterium]
MRDDLTVAVDRVLHSGRFLLGPETEAFESEFAAFCGREHAVAVASGTEALRLTLVALGIGPGDEVIVPAFTAVPTAAAVCASGAVPVPVDVDPETAGLDPGAAGAAVTDRTRGVVPVHLYGRPSPLPDIGVPVIEDAAHAHGAPGPGGSAAAVYSFYPTKNLGGVGDGGAVVTDDAALADAVRRLRAHGARDGYEHVEIAGNSRMSEVESAALRVGLGRLTDLNARRRMIAARYRAAAPGLRWQTPHPGHVYHLCVARVADRDSFRESVPFETAVHYPRALTQQSGYARFTRSACPEAESWAAECVSLPCFPEMTDDEIETVCRALA